MRHVGGVYARRTRINGSPTRVLEVNWLIDFHVSVAKPMISSDICRYSNWPGYAQDWAAPLVLNLAVPKHVASLQLHRLTMVWRLLIHAQGSLWLSNLSVVLRACGLGMCPARLSSMLVCGAAVGEVSAARGSVVSLCWYFPMVFETSWGFCVVTRCPLGWLSP